MNPLNEQIQNYEYSIILESLKKYSFDGVVLDWLRFDDYAMDLSNTTRKEYKRDQGYDPIQINFSTTKGQLIFLTMENGQINNWLS